ncbi:MAG: hypothetical protein ACXVX9_05805, partial [Mycobacteriaceae bacterium]
AESPVTVQELAAFMVERIAKYKVPTRWVLSTESLPRNATGKVSRPQIATVDFASPTPPGSGPSLSG